MVPLMDTAAANVYVIDTKLGDFRLCCRSGRGLFKIGFAVFVVNPPAAEMLLKHAT